MARITREKFKTYGNVFDQFTLRNIFKLSSQGHFDELKSAISVGKEANIFSAEKKDGTQVIVKIYRLENCDFNGMYDYIKLDERYINLKTRKREIIFAWTQREFRNLLIAREAGIRVPTPICCLHNIIVMEFVGNGGAAPKLKDSIPENPQKFLNTTIKYMRKMHKVGLVHGDLSEFNILNHDENPVFIDMSQSTTKKASNYSELLERDIKNICRFFKKIGTECCKEYLKTAITDPTDP